MLNSFYYGLTTFHSVLYQKNPRIAHNTSSLPLRNITKIYQKYLLRACTLSGFEITRIDLSFQTDACENSEINFYLNRDVPFSADYNDDAVDGGKYDNRKKIYIHRIEVFVFNTNLEHFCTKLTSRVSETFSKK